MVAYSINTAGVLSLDPAQFNALGASETVELTFSYTVESTDGTIIPTTAVITITGSNDVPVVSGAVLHGSVNEDAALQVIDLLDNASDPDRTDTVSVDAATLSIAVTAGTWAPTVVHTLNPTTGEFSFDPAQFTALTQGSSITLTLSYNVIDGEGGSTPATATVTITGTNDAPVVTTAPGQDIGTVEDPGERSTANGGTVVGDVTATGTLTATDADLNQTAGLTWAVQGTPSTTYGTFAITAAGVWTYTLDPALANSLGEGAAPVETFTVRVSDGVGGFADQVISVTINGTNDAPVIDAATSVVTGSVIESSANPAPMPAPSTTGTLVATDPDTGDTLTWSIAGTGAGTYGTLTLVNNVWTYTLNDADTDTQALITGQTGTETFTLRVTDSQGVYSSQTITVSINGRNEVFNGLESSDNLAGTDTGDSIFGNGGDDTLTGGLGNDAIFGGAGDDSIVGGSDDDFISGGTGSDIIQGQSGVDTVALSGNWVDYAVSFAAGTYTFLNRTTGQTESGDIDSLSGIESVSFAGGPAVAIATVLNDAPVVAAQIADQTGTEDTAFSLPLPAGTFTDADTSLGDTLTYSLASGAPAWLSINATTGAISGTPPLNFNGLVTLTVVATDIHGSTASDTFNINFTNTNDAPTVAVAVPDQTTAEDAAFSLDVSANFADVDVGDGRTYSLSASAPAWLTIDAATGVISGTPANGDVGTVNVTVTVTDTAGLSVSDTFALAVTNVNDAPTVAVAVPDQTTAEDAAFSLDVSANFADVDVGDGRTYSLAVGAPAWLTIDAATGVISGTPANGDVGTVNVTVTVTDTAGLSVSDTFALAVTNVNDAPTVVGAGVADQTTAEDAAFTLDVSANFADVDMGDGRTYSLAVGAPAWLTIDAATGVISGTPANGDVGTVNVTVTVTDTAGLSVSDTFALAVTNVNDAPTVVGAGVADQTTAEDAAFTLDVSANFADVDMGDGRTYSLAAGAPAWLTIDAATGVISGTPANGDVGTVNVTVTVTDTAGLSVSDTFALAVTNVNDAPTVVGAGVADQTTAEDAAFSLDVSANFADVDVGDGRTYSLSASAPAWLTIDAATGVISGTPANGDVGTVNVTVTVTDTAGLSVSDTFALAVTNVNDAPTVVGAGVADQTTAEDAAFSLDVSANFADVDVGDGRTYSLSASAPAWLTIDAATGVISGTPANGDVGTVNVTVTVTDTAGLSVSDTFALAVTNVNDAPTVAVAVPDQTTAEDAAFTLDVSANFADVDVGDGRTYSLSASAPAWLTIDAATGVISGTPANGDVGTVNVTVTVTDTAGASVSDTFALAVTNVNDAPTVAVAVPDQTTAEDAAFSLNVAANFADVDMGDGRTYSLSASAPAWLVIDAATGVISGTPANGDVGTVNVTVTVTDTAGLSVSDTFALAVTNTNDAPTVAVAVPDQTTAEDAAFSLNVAANFADVDMGDGRTYSLSASAPAWLTIDAATGVISGTPANGDVGTVNVTVTVTDTAGLSVSDTFALAVTNVNDAPTVAVAVPDQTTAEDAAFSLNVAANFADVDMGDGRTYSLSASAPAWLTIDAATGVISGTPANGDVGTVNVTVTVTDTAGLSVSDTFALAVTNVNDAPTVAVAVPDQTTAEDAAFSLNVAANFADVDLGDGRTYSLAVGAPAWLTIDAATGVISGTPANGDVGTVNVTVTVTDSAGLSVSDTFALAVTNTNDAPTVAVAVPDQTTAEDAAFSLNVAANFADVDMGDGRTYSLSASAPAWLTIDAATGVISGTPANGDVGTVNVTVTVTDTAGASVSDTFALAVTNVNDAPTVAVAVPDQTTAEDAAFSLNVAANFADVDMGDGRTYSLSASAPAWLVIDAATGVISGTPANGDVGTVNVTVTVTDTAGLSVSDTFALAVTNVNDAPTVAVAVPDQTTAEDAAFSLDVSANFADVDMGDGRTYSLSASAPAWLVIDAATGVISGTPANGDVGTVNVTVTVTDTAGLSVSDTFALAVTNVNDAPTVAVAVPDQFLDEDAPFAYNLPENMFTDVDDATLTYSLAAGSPAWLSINSATGQITGVPPANFTGTVSVTVVATDAGGLSAEDTFDLVVTPFNDAPEVTATITPGFSENPTLGAIAVALAITDVDSVSANSTVFLVDDAGGRFAVDGHNIVVADPLLFDFEQASSVSITVRVTDENGAQTTRTIIIPLADQTPETVTGSANGDVILSGSGADSLVGMGGDDLLGSGGGQDTLDGGLGNDTLSGGAGADVLSGGDGDDTLEGGTEGDFLSGGNGADRLDGGDGRDRAVHADATVGVRADLQLPGTNTGAAAGDVYVSIEDLGGSALNDSLFGDSGANMIWGESGDDLIQGRFGNDSLFGGAGNDTLDGAQDVDVMAGGIGNDQYWVDNAADVVFELANEGTDTVLTALASYSLALLTNVENLVGVANTGQTLTGNGQANQILASAGNDTIFGGAGDDTMSGGAGNDVFDGGAGNDVFAGGTGDDIYWTDTASDVVFERANEGFDYVMSRLAVASIGAVANVEGLVGLITTGQVLEGNTLGNLILANTGNDLLYGGFGNDTMQGNSGSDFLFGGQGNDVLVGGAGADSFVFLTALGAGNVDRITDFAVVDDTIRLEDAIFTALTATGVLANTAFTTGAAATTAAHRVIYDSATGNLFYDADGTGGTGQILFATLTPGLVLTEADFLVT